MLEPVGSKIWMPWLPWYYGALARFNAELGRWTEAAALIEKCMALDFQGNMGRMHCEWARAWMAARRSRPDWERAQAHAEAALADAKELKLRPEEAIGRLDQARLLAEKSDPDKAREPLDQATGLFRDMEMTWWLEQAEALGKELEVG